MNAMARFRKAAWTWGVAGEALLPWAALSRRGAVRGLALGPAGPISGTREPVNLSGRPPASTQLRARQGNRANSNRCVAPVALNSAPIRAGPETARREEGDVQQTQAATEATRF